MKKFLSTLTGAAALTAALLSCSKPADAVLPEGPAAGEITVRIDVPEDQFTKSAFADRKDFQINKVQVFVFDAASLLETSYYAAVSPVDNSTSVTLATFTGPKTVYAILNHDRLALTPKVSTLTNLEETLTDLSMNTPTSLVMSGKNTVTVTEYDKNKNAGAAPQSVNVFVKRLASMIQLDQVTVDFRGTALEGATFSIEELYLKNVVGKSRLGVSGVTASAGSSVLPLPLEDSEHTNYAYWYNKGTLQASGAPAVTYDVWSHSCTSAGSPSALSRILFAYPNKTAGDSHADSFSQRKTRLVVKAHVKATAYSIVDEDTYYVLDLPVLVANNVYRVTNFTITALGKKNDDKDEDLQAGRITPTITVDPWTGTTNLSYEF